MIPKEEYINLFDILVISQDLLEKYHTTEEMIQFFRWMGGQTAMEHEGEIYYYSWDYERWVRQGMQKEQGEDWD
jgi:hypothetical protein